MKEVNHKINVWFHLYKMYACTTHSSILVWSIPWTEELEGYNPQAHKELVTVEVT